MTSKFRSSTALALSFSLAVGPAWAQSETPTPCDADAPVFPCSIEGQLIEGDADFEAAMDDMGDMEEVVEEMVEEEPAQEAAEEEPAQEVAEEEPDSLAPVIVAEMQTKILSLSVGEAVMQMELAGAPVLVFRNEKGNGVNVVYKREDGNVGWIDPTAAT